MNLFIIILNFAHKIKYFNPENMKYYYSIYIILLITNRLSALAAIRSILSESDGLPQSQWLREYEWSHLRRNMPCPFESKSIRHWTTSILYQTESAFRSGPDYCKLVHHLVLNGPYDASTWLVSDSEYILHYGWFAVECISKAFLSYSLDQRVFSLNELVSFGAKSSPHVLDSWSLLPDKGKIGILNCWVGESAHSFGRCYAACSGQPRFD